MAFLRSSRCPNCGQKATGISCRWCGYPLMRGRAVKEPREQKRLKKPVQASAKAEPKAKEEAREKAKTTKNLYTWAGLGLLVAGSLVFLAAYFVLLLTWLAALGISMLILSFILLALGRTIPKLPPEVSALFLETGINNIAALVEELGIKSKAIYLPSSLTSGGPQALIPLHFNPLLSPITKAFPQRLIVRYGASSDNIGLLVTTTGTTAVGMLESIPGPISAELESALTFLFRGILGVADGTRVITSENHIEVEIYNSHIENKTAWFYQCLGGPLASVVASVAAEAWNRPVTIKQEEHHRGRCSIELEVLGEDI